MRVHLERFEALRFTYRRTARFPGRHVPLPVLVCTIAGIIGSVASGSVGAEPVRIAFTGDQGTGDDARAVLDLVAQEGADLLLVQGDLGYGRDAADDWIANIENALGPDLPVLFVVGNHENYQWPTYRKWLIERLERTPELVCEGDPGVKAHCAFRGISIVQSAPGVHEVAGVSPDDGYADYITDELSGDGARWRLCTWHKNQRDMQVGDKDDETGWAVYDACLAAGAIVATAHEHSWSRTFLMRDFRNKEVVHRGSHMEIGPGRSFAFVSGLGGRAIRAQEQNEHWWASVYTTSQDAMHGALFCTFDDVDARCEFKDISGGVPDAFTLESRNVPGEPAPQDEDPAPELPGAAPATSRSGAFGPVELIVSGSLVVSGIVAGLWRRSRRRSRSR